MTARKVKREEILDYETYEDRRKEIRARAMEAKDLRRVQVGDVLVFLFENPETIRYQVQEMVRAERHVRESDIQHEIDTYNELLGDEGELGCTLMIAIDEPEERDRRLRAWLDLPEHLYVRVDDGRKIRPRYDPRQVGEDRISAVQFLKFPIGDARPVAVGCDHPELLGETPLSTAQQEALLADLR